MTDSRLLEVFMDIQRGLPRQGPGDRESTLLALALCDPLPQRPDVLDIGCGPGMHTMVLAHALEGNLTAVDTSEEYLAELRARAREEGVADRVRAELGDMNSLPYAPASFDLIWSEGAAYIMGFRRALTVWRSLLRPGGCIAVSELVWTRSDPPPAVVRFFGQQYPDMMDVAQCRAAVEQAGYVVAGDFTVPDAAWWNDYYRPLEAKIPGLRQRYAGDSEALELVESAAREIDMRRRFGNHYGYLFVVGHAV